MIEVVNQDHLSNLVPTGDAWNIELNLDAGVYGQPSHGLKFYFEEHMKLDKHKKWVKSDARSFQID